MFYSVNAALRQCYCERTIVRNNVNVMFLAPMELNEELNRALPKEKTEPKAQLLPRWLREKVADHGEQHPRPQSQPQERVPA